MVHHGRYRLGLPPPERRHDPDSPRQRRLERSPMIVLFLLATTSTAGTTAAATTTTTTTTRTTTTRTTTAAASSSRSEIMCPAASAFSISVSSHCHACARPFRGMGFIVPFCPPATAAAAGTFGISRNGVGMVRGGSGGSALHVQPLKTDEAPPYRPRYQPLPAMPPPQTPDSSSSSSTADGEYYSSDIPYSSPSLSSAYSDASSSSSSSSSSYSAVKSQRVTLTRFLSNAVQIPPSSSSSSSSSSSHPSPAPVLERDVESLLLSVQMACKTISHLVNRAGINQLSAAPGRGASLSNTYETSDALEQYDFRLNSMRKLDELSTNVLRNALRFTGKLQMVAPARDGRPLPGEEGLDDIRDECDDDDEDDYDDDDDSGGGGSDDGRKTNKKLNKKKKTKHNKKGKKKAMVQDVAEVMDEYGPAAHQPGVLIAKALDGKYVACFDPLDGSGNADAAICTGTVFGVFETPPDAQGNVDDDDDDDDSGDGVDGGDASKGVGKDVEESLLVRSVLQPGRSLVAAGYCLYSSATVLVLTVGDGTHGFTLDPQIGEFVLTHPNIRIPPRGNVYSCNEANSEGWDTDLRLYLRALKTGNGQTKTRYALRYVGSMVGDIHRTLMYGGIFCYPKDSGVHPRGNLQLLYKSAPMAFVVEQAGGRSSDGMGELLDVVPRRVHQRSPCFIGSPEDIAEMKTYIKHRE